MSRQPSTVDDITAGMSKMRATAPDREQQVIPPRRVTDVDVDKVEDEPDWMLVVSRDEVKKCLAEFPPAAQKSLMKTIEMVMAQQEAEFHDVFRLANGREPSKLEWRLYLKSAVPVVDHLTGVDVDVQEALKILDMLHS